MEQLDASNLVALRDAGVAWLIGHDELVGLAASERVFGYNSNDTLSGNDGDDTLFGGTQHDLLSRG